MDSLRVSVSKSSQPLAVLIAAASVREHIPTTLEWTSNTCVQVDSDVSLSGNLCVTRYLVRLAPAAGLYGYTPLEASQIDQWLEFSLVNCGNENYSGINHALDTVNTAAGQRPFLVGNRVSLADVVVWSSIQVNSSMLSSLDDYEHAHAWYRRCGDLPAFKEGVANQPEQDEPLAKPEDKGKFVDLPGASEGNVVVRFPPEASGFLHIGHAKAALLNQYYQQTFSGKLIMRFDDTNPVKEKADFEEVILDDLRQLQVHYDHFSRTSDHFDYLLQCAEDMIKKSLAYVDDTPQEEMQKEREQRVPSRHRESTVSSNLQLWEDMKAGNEKGLKCCLRAKIDYASDNGCLRDPALFRCKLEPHVQTGTKYKVYPTYDFACPIVDSVEGVTHALRTMEYHDRDEQYYWILDALGLRKPYIWEYSRLNLQHTVLSKRKLTWFVEQGLVDGWDDPRFPTVRGVMRRGMSVEGLRQFIIAQGSSKANVTMEWDKIWAFNRKVIDPVAERCTAVVKEKAVEVTVKGYTGGSTKEIPKHPKFPNGNKKELHYSTVVYVDGEDASTFTVGETVTFMSWGNVVVEKIVMGSDGVVTGLEVKFKPDDVDYKNTTKVTWLPKLDSAPLVPTQCVYYDDIISKGVLAKEDNFKDFINYDSKTVVEMYGEPNLRSLKKSDVIQLQRKGFFICDQPYVPPSMYTSAEAPCELIAIPDGRSKALPTSGSKAKKVTDAGASTDQAVSSAKGVSKVSKLEPTATASGIEVDDFKRRISEQGDKVRELKTSAAAKDVVDAEVKVLLELKQQLKDLTGEDVSSGSSGKKKGKGTTAKPSQAPAKKQSKEPKATAEAVPPSEEDDEGRKHLSRLGLEVKKNENFSEWYSQVIKKAEMIEYYDVSGCYILRPWSYSIWDRIKDFFDMEIKKLGVENVYFPIFVSKSALEREKTHIEDFAPEVAWVTKSGQSELAEPIAIRPTSETVMYPAYAKWIQSHRDLPLQLNQWNNVVRWEFKQPQPFLRTREFLWQEGHSAFATREEAVEEVYAILELYRRVYEELLAIPVIRGKKTEKEKFAGADFTTTVEGYISASGRGIQGATSHHLGQNFSKMFEIAFESPTTGEHEFVYQNSWGLTTRTIGVLTMVHGDDKGLVLPPRVACIQVIIVPCGLSAKLRDEERVELLKQCEDFVASLKVAGIRCKGDYRDNYSPGWKFNHWELKGVPVRVEIGPRDVKNKQYVAVRRDTGQRNVHKRGEQTVKELMALLDDIQACMFKNAKEIRDANISMATSWIEFVSHLNQKKLVLAPYCGSCEDKIKKDSAKHDDASEVGQALMGAKALCIPFDQPAEVDSGTPCVHPECSNKANCFTLFGRSY